MRADIDARHQVGDLSYDGLADREWLGYLRYTLVISNSRRTGQTDWA